MNWFDVIDTFADDAGFKNPSKTAKKLVDVGASPYFPMSFSSLRPFLKLEGVLVVYEHPEDIL